MQGVVWSQGTEMCADLKQADWRTGRVTFQLSVAGGLHRKRLMSAPEVVFRLSHLPNNVAYSHSILLQGMTALLILV